MDVNDLREPVNASKARFNGVTMHRNIAGLRAGGIFVSDLLTAFRNNA